MAANSSLLYRRLGFREVRLLRILPPRAVDNVEDPIYCVLETASLDAMPQFTALSYEWGGSDPEISPLDTYANGRKMDLKVNLTMALLYLREYVTRLPLLFWIDAICINQNDVAERGHQVRIMTEIYQKAIGVFAWLGRENNDSRLGMAFLRELEDECHHRRVTVGNVDVWVRRKLADPEYKARWDGLFHILERSYWGRVWIIQEIAVAQEVIIQCGWDRASLDKLRMIALVIHRTSLQTVFDFSENARKFLESGVRFLKVEASIAAQKTRRNEDQQGILRLIMNTSRSLCSDPRDRVYAMLGIAYPYPGLELDIDYSLSIAQVYTNVAKYIIMGSRRLDMLLYCRRRPNPDCILPSWAPDWMTYSEDLHIILWGNDLNNTSACGSREAFASFSRVGNLLAVKAIMLGTVKDILAGEHWVSITRIKEILKLWISFVTSTLQNGQDSKSNTVTKPPLRILYETLFYCRSSAAQTEQGWPYYQFPEALFSLDLDSPDIQNVHVKLISMLKDALCSESALFSLPVETDGKKTIGICSTAAKAGDLVAIVIGCRFPLVLRLIDGNYELISEAYVYGYMTGDVVGKLPEVDVVLM